MPLAPKKLNLVKISSFTKFADSLARSLRANLSWSKKLRNAVTLHRATEQNGVVTAYVTVGEKNSDIAGMARAYEHGSGLHGKNRRKYLIQGRPYLAFFGTNGHGNAYSAYNPTTRKGVGSKNIVVTRQVMHPGVEARPYLGKSITSTLKKATPELAVEIERSIVEHLRMSLKDLSK